MIKVPKKNKCMSDNKTPLILTIDDEKVVTQSIHNFLEDYDYAVIEAENGKIGIEYFKKEKPDLVLVDLRMPEMDGLDVLDWFMKNSPDTPVIVVSGSGIIADVVEALRLGAWDYLLKPIEDMSVLLHSVEKALERAKLIHENRAYQVQLEHKFTAATQALEETEARFKRLAENARDVIFRLALPEGKFEFVSPASKETFGYSPEEFYNNPKLIWKIIHKNWSQFLKKQWYNLIKGETYKVYEYLTVHRSGAEKWMYQRNVLIFDKSGAPEALEGFITDITERKQLESQLRQAQKMEAIGTLAGGIAHDFNNILAIIMGNASLLKILLPDMDEAQTKTDHILTASQRASELIMQILAFSRQSEKTNQAIQISLIIKEVLKLMKAALPSTIEIKQKITASSALIQADPTQIHQILMNLCTNANHAMEKTGGILKVTLDEIEPADDRSSSHPDLPPGSWVKLSVSDTGHGMKPVIIERIFDPYFTTKKKDVGTGLGLAVVHGIVKSLGGLIEVKSNQGLGSTFNIFLPGVENESVLESKKSDESPSGMNERVLFVDDEELLVDVGKNILEGLGYQVITTTNPEEALNTFRAQPDFFDIVITDMTMPHMTGETLSKEIMLIRPDIPIVLCTGFNDLIDEKKARAAGIKKYIMKPFTINKIAKTIREILD